MPTWLRPCEVARLLGITPDRVRQLADEGRLPVVRVGQLRFFAPEDVEELRRARQRERTARARRRVQGRVQTAG